MSLQIKKNKIKQGVMGQKWVIGHQTCHRTGESAVATGADGAEGVCVLIMYCSGAAYLDPEKIGN